MRPLPPCYEDIDDGARSVTPVMQYSHDILPAVVSNSWFVSHTTAARRATCRLVVDLGLVRLWKVPTPNRLAYGAHSAANGTTVLHLAS